MAAEVEGGPQGVTLRLFRRVRAELAAVVRGGCDLDRHLEPGVNSVGWLVWHIARGQDRNLSELTGRTQLWVTDGWAQRFGRAADPGDTGYGHTAEQAASFRSPDSGTLLGYVDATHGLAEHYLMTAPATDLARAVTSPTLGDTHTVEERLAGQLYDSLAHAGQIALLLGLLAR